MRALRMSLAAVAAVLALAGCAALPTSGGVQNGGVIDTETQVRGVFQPNGPQKDSPPQDIVTDFIQAALDPQNDYQTARLFLSGDAQQKWNPNASVSVQSGTGTASPGSDPTRVSYTTTPIATINATGVYTEIPVAQRQQTSVPFVLAKVKVNGSEQWRITTPPDGVIISESTFDGVFGAYPLYFYAPGYKYLVPDVRWFATTDTVATRIANALLAGPTGYVANGVLVSAFPPGTTLDTSGVVVDSAIASVDVSAEAKQTTTSSDRSRMQQQLSASLTSVSNVRSVSLSIGGVAVGTSSTGDTPTVQPSVNAAILVQEKDAFGFVSGDTVTSIAGISARTKGLALAGATYSDATSALAARSNAGVYLFKPDADPFLIDARGNVVDPSIDPTGFVWYAKGNKLSDLWVYLGNAYNRVDTSSLGATPDTRIISMDVSRDGARLLLYLDSSAGPQLVVVGINRDQNNLPKKLGTDAVFFPVSADQPIDATWESDRAIATLSGVGAATTVTEWQIGGPSTNLGTVPDATQIVGGNGGAAGLRVLDHTGTVLRASGTGTSWGSAGYTASFIATQQPG